ncbi:hypothetical protein XNOV1_A011600 [Xyrichtys novacula]|uniref:Uncharacterized protein n=1 Tax=Xyrichtys novacula TaxID=13765 RepID=A0AAV1FKD2_XYRNO|nr:hypothetical protein XNOV1_A011600 [Xyrichtys novacula]
MENVLPPQSRMENCILHGCKGEVNDGFVAFSSKADPLRTFKEIHDMKYELLTQTSDCGGMQDVCESIPDELSLNSGYHRNCQCTFFCNATHALARTCQAVNHRPKREHMDSSVLFGNYCIFCKSGTVKRASGKRYSLQKFQSTAYKSIETKAMELGDEDLLCKIVGVDLVARQAQFHDCCRKQYLVKQASQPDSTDAASTKKAMISKAFTQVYDHIQTEIIQKGQVVKLAYLKDLYNDTLRKFEGSASPITAHNPRQKIECHPNLKDSVDFLSCPFKNMLVFCRSQESMTTTVCSAYEMGNTDWSKEISHDLHQKIIKAFKNSEPLTWPPTAHDIPEPKKEIPSEVLQFVLNLICGDKKPSQKPSHAEECLAISISQYLCRAVTSGRWKMKKHILLCMTLRHLFRSKSITTLINKLGHCESYSYSLELETALANSIVESASIISESDIIRGQPDGAVFHSDWDNFDQLVSNIYAAGIYMQDLGSSDTAGLTSVQPRQDPTTRPTTKQRSFKRPAQDLPTYYKRKRSEPVLAASNSNTAATCSNSKSDSDLVWVIARKVNSVDQHIPGLSGWLSITGCSPKCLTTIGYYPMINAPITELSTIQECLRSCIL